MQIASSFRYRGIPVTITIDQISWLATIIYLNKSKIITASDMHMLKRVAESAIDREVDGDLHNFSGQFRTDVSL